jgi:putrescine importer
MASSTGTSQLRRRLGLADLILYGIVIIQPTAPMPIFGIVSEESRGHVVLPILHAGPHSMEYFTRPFYDPSTFTWASMWTGTSVAALTYIGFDSISTLSEEAVNPRRNILLATVLTCLMTGVLASTEVYAAQLVWPHSLPFPDIDTAYVFVAGRAGGRILFDVVNATLLLATMGSGIGTQLGAARLLYGMGRDNALPRKFFGAIDSKRGIPANNVIFIGVLAMAGSLLMSFQLGAELLNFGAFLAFMGVNASTMVHYFVKGRDRRWSFLALPLGGFAVCFYTWINLRWTAKLAGGIWLALGILYGIYRWRFARVEMKTVTGV